MPKQKKRGRAVIRPVCVGSVLLVMYVVFVYLILITFEENTGRDSGAAYHLRKSVSSAVTLIAGQGDSPRVKGQNYDKPLDAPAPARVSSPTANESSLPGLLVKNPSPSPSGNEHPDLIDFCGECMWKDTLITCNKRVAWEVEQGRYSEFESKKSNLIYCTRPHDMHISDYCGTCRWKDTEFTCDERVAFEMERNGLSTVEAKRRNLAFCKNPPYILSPLCGKCVRALTNMTSKMYRSGVPCYDVMLRRIKSGLANSLMEAAKAVGEEFEQCHRCAPATCWKDYFKEMSMDIKGLDERGEDFLTKYWRFDQAAPKITLPTTIALPSIPKEFRIPPSRFRDIESFLTEKYNQFELSNDTHVNIFIEYNPSLAPIPPRMKSNLPKHAAYALALRVTPANNCFRREAMSRLPQKVWEHTMMSPTNLLGIALLDEEYEILPGYDILVDIATQLGFQKDGYGTTYFGEPTFMDYRFFTLNGNLYLHANADVTVVTQLDLRSKRHSKKPSKEEFKLDVVYGEDRLEVTMLHQFNTIWSGGDRGKNFALFAVPNRTHPNEPDSVYAEVEINPIHQVQQLYLDEVEMLKRSFIKKRIRRNYAVDKIMMRKVATNGNLTDSNGIDPDPSFFTVDEYWFPGIRPAFRKNGHGGACCVSLSRNEVLAQGDHIFLTNDSWGENEYLLVGVAHTSVIWRRWYSDKRIPDSEKGLIPHTHYISFFYAFEPRPPFNLRARSGYFCLGFAGDNGIEGGMFNPHSILTVNRKLSQHNETFSCPQIHFVSSFIEKVGNSSQTVIGYGINDCTPRIVEVSKKEIARMIFSDPWEMKIEKKSSETDRVEAENFDKMTDLPLNWQ